MTLARGNASVHQVVVLLDEPKRVRRWTIMMKSTFCNKALSVRAFWPLLGNSGPQARLTPSSLVRPHAVSTSLVGLLGSVAGSAVESLATTHHLTCGLEASVILVHFVLESRSSDRPSCLEDTQLMLIYDLGVS